MRTLRGNLLNQCGIIPRCASAIYASRYRPRLQIAVGHRLEQFGSGCAGEAPVKILWLQQDRLSIVYLARKIVRVGDGAWGLNSAHIHGTHVPMEEP